MTDRTQTELHPAYAHRHHQDEEREDEFWFNERLITTRMVLLSGQVNDNLARRVNQSLLLLEGEDAAKPIDLLINSGGGSVSSGLAIYDMIRYIRPDVRCVAAGLTGSIATIIYAATQEREQRVALPNARFLIHQPLIPASVFGPASDLEITANEILKTRKRINEILAEACGHSYEKVAKDTSRDRWMNAEEAQEYGLVGRIVRTRAEL
jgi:ATP-dependent Clp protease protease subunit